MIGEIVKVIVDRPLGSYHPEHKDLYYPVNYGYIEGIMAPNGEEIDNPDGKDLACFQGCDPGVSFISEYNPNNGIISVLVSNYGDNVWREMRKIREVLY